MDELVANLLTSKNIQFKSSGRDYLIRCINPDHEDSNPSCRVDKVSGVFHCYSCGFKGNIFSYYGVITNFAYIRTIKLKEKLNGLREQIEPDFPVGHTPYTEGSIRGISLATIRKFKGFYTNEDQNLLGRIIFPVYSSSDKLVGFIARHLHSSENPKYLILPKHTKLGLFPSKLKVPGRSLVLVEGLFDMLNLYDNGLTNVSCCFGTDTLKNKAIKEKLLPFKAQGVSKIFILFDSDKAGKTAALAVKPILEAEGFMAEVINLPEKFKDPGELDIETIQTIKKYVDESSNY